MKKKQQFPAIPLLTHDPYFSIWSTSDNPTTSTTKHWTKERKRLEMYIQIDGTDYQLLSRGEGKNAEWLGTEVRPTVTEYRYRVNSRQVRLRFCSPLLPDDLDRLSTPITLVRAECSDPKAVFRVVWHDDICYDGSQPPAMIGCAHRSKSLNHGMMGRQMQNILSHSADGACIDWGYAWMSSDAPVEFAHGMGHYRLSLNAQLDRGVQDVLLGYDDVVSIDYFGFAAKAWYARNGKTMRQAMEELWQQRNEVWTRCERFDEELMRQAQDIGGAEYVKLVCASYRQAVSAHKLIADEQGQPVFLSKENNSNGCIGTVDVSYPSAPLFLLYAPELVRAMCRPILRFAQCPVWKHTYAPHDVGRYPHATGQVYGLDAQALGGDVCGEPGDRGVYLPYYVLAEENDIYLDSKQMPVEECGNMLLLLAAALRADHEEDMVRTHQNLLRQWAEYLEKNGADPGEQLCTDDFAGHLAGNVNLAMKAACGIAAYAYICETLGDAGEGRKWLHTAQRMAQEICRRADRGDHTSLTMDGPAESWSLKYNMVWDLLFGFGFCEQAWYDREIEWYLRQERRYGTPLDNREEYTKSDWLLWVAAMCDKEEHKQRMYAAVARYLEETPSRVPFSDWYDTQNGRSIGFIARSVQGGIFMPLLRQAWSAQQGKEQL